METPQKRLQLFVQFPDLNLPTRTLTLTPSSSPSLSLTALHLLPLLNLPQTLTLENLYFTINGKSLPLSSPVPSTGTLSLRLRLPGGGGDGGATGAESRDCYLNMYASKKPDKADPNEARISRWTTCALSAEPLSSPVVLDRLGNLFNKEPLVEALLHKRLPKQFCHIKGLKDMIPVHLDKLECPVTGLEFNGKYGFLAIRTCGHVLSAKALKEVKSDSCLVCHKGFEEGDKIVINGSEEEVAALRERMEGERGKVRERKDKKKHAVCEEEKVVEEIGGRKKRFKAVDAAPANATKAVYASIFTSSKKSDFKETYSCRSLPLGRN